MAHEVRTEVFEGPIDLLLHLITRQRVDIYEVSIAQITDEYLQVLDAMEDLDLETATGFLVVAATLLELKSIRLLPAPADLDDADLQALEARDMLLARLVELSTFREAGAWLKQAIEAGDLSHPREVGLEAPFAELQPELVLRIAPEDLVGAAARVFAPVAIPQLSTSHMSPITATVREAISELSSRLAREGRSTFEELCGRRDRIEVVVRFLGLLELFKAGAVEISQSGRFGSITATWTGEVDAADVLAEAEEYSIEEGV